MTIQAPTKRIALFVNPLAGKGNALRWRERAEAYLRRVGIAYQVIGLDYPPDLDAFTDVVIAGGDGTINHILNHYPNIRLPIGVIPGGTGNDLALAFDRGMNPEGCLETAVFGVPEWVDAGMCNGRIFMNCLGVGFDGEVAADIGRLRWLPGWAKYYWTVVRKIFAYRSVLMEVEGDCGPYRAKALTVMAANSRHSGGGFRVAPMASMNDGRLDMVIIDDIPAWKRLIHLPGIRKGRHVALPFVHTARCTRMVVTTTKPLQAHMDGELILSARFEVSVLPARFLVRRGGI